MFYRFTKAGARIAVDLDGFYEGESLFLLGGSPALRDLPLELLSRSGVVTMGMNNVPCVYKPNLWVCGDKPQCFSPHIHASPEILKFTTIPRRDLEVPGTGKKVRQFPSFFFFGTRETFTPENFLDPDRDLVWWRSVFPMALQLAHRLGFFRVFLVGCGFTMNKTPGKQYAWNTSLTPDQAQYSANTYSKDLVRLKALLPTFQRKGFYVVSCTPGSAAHDLIPYMSLEHAINEATRGKAQAADTTKLVHSSDLKVASLPTEPVAAAVGGQE